MSGSSPDVIASKKAEKIDRLVPLTSDRLQRREWFLAGLCPDPRAINRPVVGPTETSALFQDLLTAL